DAALDATLAAVDAQADGRLEAFTWGAANEAQVQHPLSRVVPGLPALPVSARRLRVSP
ncbi:MAG: hypothetical protein ICV73_17635, partial [Acetobacteraceae bacterium]|nr:hypothetical protein [Acetobacteraceae bacterium]